MTRRQLVNDMGLMAYHFSLKSEFFEYDMDDNIDVFANSIEEAIHFMVMRGYKLEEWGFDYSRPADAGLIITHYHPG